MKITLYTICLFAPLALALTGCQSSATEKEKAEFNRTVLNNENMNEQQEVDDSIDEGYQAGGAGAPPAWEMPAD